jgi:cytochrome c553
MLTLLVVMGSCSSTPESFDGTRTQERMLTHFDLALELRTHAISGNLNRFRATAGAIAELGATPDLPAEIFLQFGPLRYEAEVGSEVRTHAAAARATAEIARTCGDCHEANGIELPAELPMPRATSADPDVLAHMERLTRTTRQLWSGLAGPAESDWQAGTAGLIEAGGLPSGLAGTISVADLEFASNRLRRLADEAAEAEAPGYRVRALGEIWGTCAECHALLPSGAIER